MDCLHDVGALAALEKWAEERSERAARAAAEEAARRYREWLQAGPARGLARQHAASKCRGQWVPGRMVPVSEGEQQGFAQVAGQWSENAGRDGRVVVGVEAIMQHIQYRGEGMTAPADVQQEVDAEAAKWEGIWTDEHGLEECAWPDDDEAELSVIDAKRILEAASTFADGVGLGWDRFHPKALRRVPIALVEELGSILMAAERRGGWGGMAGVVITALIPKSGGGLRPIGLLPTVVRLWARIRAGEVQLWEARNERGYLYGGRGKGAMAAAWKFAARAEAARLQGAVYAAVLLDQDKAFDRVPHHHVVRAAREWGYPIPILRLSLAAYKMERVVGIGGVFSRTIRPFRGLAAGSVHATRELRALMIGVFDKVTRMSPSAELTVYVDDSTVECVGTQRTVVQAVVGATVLACSELEERGITFSQTKNVVLASRKAVGLEVQDALRRWGVRWSKFGKMLGVGAAAGVRRSTRCLVERAAAFARRGGLFHGLRRAKVDVARVLRTGGLAAAQFGQAALGLADYPLMQMRRRVAALIGGDAAGKDPNMVLTVADARLKHMVDPAFAAHTEVVGHWALAVWERWLPIEALHKSVVKARMELAKAKRHWSVVRGPASALVATLARVGWTLVDAVTAYTDLQEEVSFLRDSPAMVKMLMNQAVRRWRWRVAGLEVRVGDGRGEGPLWQPVAELIAAGRWRDPVSMRVEVKLAAGERAALQSAVVGGQWSQCRLFAAGLSDTADCQLCAAVGVNVRGSLVHRIYGCPQVEARVTATRPQTVQMQGGARGRGGASEEAEGYGIMEWERGLVRKPSIARRERVETLEWVVEVRGLIRDAVVFIDGSQYDAFDEDFLTLGWAFAVFVRGELVGLARGRPPPFVRSILAAEAWALAMAVEWVDVATSSFFTDCMAVKTLALGGRRKATASGQVNARIWNTVFTRTDEQRPEVEWIPAHQGEQQIGVAITGSGTPLTRAQWEGNQLVDTHAKRAAEGGRRSKEVIATYVAAMKRTAALAGWIGAATHAANNGSEEPHRDSTAERARRWRMDAGGEGLGRAAGKGEKEVVVRTLRPIQLGGHDLVKIGEGWCCTVCNRASRNWNSIAGRVCKGAAAGVWARRAKELGGRGGSDGAGHVRAAQGGAIWCIKCGSYAVRWAVGLAEPCREGPMNPSQRRVLARLKAGRHPRSNVALEGTLMIEVPGLQLVRAGGEGGRRGSSGLVGERSKHFVGYVRRPGGMRLIEASGDGGSQADEEVEGEGGPRRAFLDRRRRLRMATREEVAEDGGAHARRRAWEAREEEACVTEGMVERWKAVLTDAGAEDRQGTHGGREVPVEGLQRDVELAGGQAVMNRKDFISELKRVVQEARVEGRMGERVEHGEQGGGAGAGVGEQPCSGTGGGARLAVAQSEGAQQGVGSWAEERERLGGGVAGGAHRRAGAARAELVKRLWAEVDEQRGRGGCQ